MGILDEIVAHKRTEVASAKELYPIKLLERSAYFETEPVSLKKYLLRPDKVGIIAEIKRRSPSKGVLNAHISVEALSIGYMQAGASALSVLTDKKYFGGSNEDLAIARKFNYCPILRKDFIVDEYQIVEAKSIGADAILLIAAVLSADEMKQLATAAKKLRLEVLAEVHGKEELEKIPYELVDVLGVNNRDLKTFKTDVSTSLKLAASIPNQVLKVSESGISDADTIRGLKKAGFTGFLIGETFMKTSRPERACAKLVEEIGGA